MESSGTKKKVVNAKSKAGLLLKKLENTSTKDKIKNYSHAVKGNQAAAQEFIGNISENIEGKVVTTVSLPNRIVLLKIMRACVGVTDVKKLWIYQDVLH